MAASRPPPGPSKLGRQEKKGGRVGKRDVNSAATNGEVPEIHKDRKKWIISLHFGCGFTQNRKTTLRCRQNGKGIRGAGAIKNFY